MVLTQCMFWPTGALRRCFACNVSIGLRALEAEEIVLATISVPCSVFVVALPGMEAFRRRMIDVVYEVTAYSQCRFCEPLPSDRLVCWRTVLKATDSNSLLGHPSDSLDVDYRKLGGEKITRPVTDNSHQLFLLAAVGGRFLEMLSLVTVYEA